MTIKILNADATDEEVAAIVLALASLQSASAPPTPRHTSRWAQPAQSVRRPLQPGLGAWRSSMMGR